MSYNNALLNDLFPKGYTDDWDSDHIEKCLFKLGTYKVSDLLKKSEAMKSERVTLEERIQELAITNYKTFIETAECSQELFSQYNGIEKKLDKLLYDIPNFEEKCATFGEKSGSISQWRKQNSSTLEKSAQILEILELPQLMNSFITDGLYEDALELAGYVRKLESKNSDIPIFKSIVADIDKAWLLMLHQLVSQLRGDLSLPKCLQILGILRRMEVFSETELRLKFLQCRSCWLDHCLEIIPKNEVSHHLSKTIEVTRVNLFNILTQYRAVFNDDERGPLILSTTTNLNVNQNLILFSWIKSKISDFLLTLESDLQDLTPIESILDQCMYFGASFSKIGCDFRTSMIPIFTKKICKDFKESVFEGNKTFEKNIDRFTLIDKNYPGIPWKTKSENQMQPPDSLLEFYPLAEYTNNILSALNNLRLCAPIAILDEIVATLEASLVVISKLLLKLYIQEQQAFSTTSKDAFTRLCMSFSDDLVPYLQKCLHIIYQPSQIASTLGVSVKILQDEGITFLNRELVIAPIVHLLPMKTDSENICIIEAVQ
ncbi:unnamed protein product [Phaedon cochleariae]|uniref:Conserved oligomeric Golgi complex subunit 8 n=1 Tax=Phaedon cochleariae TaxID=80249 RepID=A0A9P0GRV0_PHACE|nr:unnamed protein product [Phaedon cochleariae]